MKLLIASPAQQVSANRKLLDSAIKQVLDSGWYILGRAVEAFENAFAAYCGTNYCVSVANGTDALELALRAVNVGAGDEVITVANAGGYTSIACHLVGAVPVYVDVNNNLTISPQEITNALSPKTKAVVVTHLYGQAADILAVRACLPAHIALIEDCAQAHGARLHGKTVGTWGDIATFSFYPTKNLGALGDGGAIVTNNQDIADAVRAMRQYGWSEKYKVNTLYGRNSRLDELQAAILTAKLPYLDDWNARRRAVVSAYQAANPNLDWVNPITESYVAHLCVVRLPNRANVRAKLETQGIQTAIHYPILDCDQSSWRQAPHRVVGKLPISRMATSAILTLPCFPELTESEVNFVCENLSKIC
jgi:aminotransferase EvaB